LRPITALTFDTAAVNDGMAVTASLRNWGDFLASSAKISAGDCRIIGRVQRIGGAFWIDRSIGVKRRHEGSKQPRAVHFRRKVTCLL
jgi:hypothetical protein